MSVKSNGKEGATGSDFPSLSGNGRYACFESLEQTHRAPDAGPDDDVFVHDRKTGKTLRASVKSNGKEAAGLASSDSCSLSPDGRYVAFVSDGKLAKQRQQRRIGRLRPRYEDWEDQAARA